MDLNDPPFWQICTGHIAGHVEIKTDHHSDTRPSTPHCFRVSEGDHETTEVHRFYITVVVWAAYVTTNHNFQHTTIATQAATSIIRLQISQRTQPISKLWWKSRKSFVPTTFDSRVADRRDISQLVL
jgi:hypothetical protein